MKRKPALRKRHAVTFPVWTCTARLSHAEIPTELNIRMRIAIRKNCGRAKMFVNGGCILNACQNSGLGNQMDDRSCWEKRPPNASLEVYSITLNFPPRGTKRGHRLVAYGTRCRSCSETLGTPRCRGQQRRRILCKQAASLGSRRDWSMLLVHGSRASWPVGWLASLLPDYLAAGKPTGERRCALCLQR